MDVCRPKMNALAASVVLRPPRSSSSSFLSYSSSSCCVDVTKNASQRTMNRRLTSELPAAQPQQPRNQIPASDGERCTRRQLQPCQTPHTSAAAAQASHHDDRGLANSFCCHAV